MSQDFRLKYSRNYDRRVHGEGKGIEILKGQKMINSATYRIELQDHTIGDLLRISLLKRKDVKFAGYRVPHPLENILEVKVQTTTDKTNEIVQETLVFLQKDLFELENQFDKLARQKMLEGT